MDSRPLWLYILFWFPGGVHEQDCLRAGPDRRPGRAARSRPGRVGGLDFALGLGLGVESFGDETWQKISLTPDLAFGKFGIGVEVTFHYRFENSDLTILEDDWVPDPFTFQETMSLYLAKFRYVRYGLKGDPLFVKLGSIEDGTLGNGFIMGNYANTLFMPERRVFGLSLDVDGQLFGFPYVGLETHVGDLSAFDVMGARLFVRPLIGTQAPIVRNLQIGGNLCGRPRSLPLRRHRSRRR